jgi:predicted nucleotidyltransferase
MTMLDPDQIDLSELGQALQDHSEDHEWWFDPATGELVVWSELAGDELDEDHPGGRGLIFVEPVPSHDAYDDMVQFAARVVDPALSRRLERALGGRGAFRRFKDELYDHPDVRADWHGFVDARMARRAADWLAEQGVIDAAARDALITAHPDPAQTATGIGRSLLAREVAHDLRDLFGERLQQVRLYGSSARGDEDPDSELDLLVVLADRVDFWSVRSSMDEILWRHTLESGIVVSALPVSADDVASTTKPALRRAIDDGVAVA